MRGPSGELVKKRGPYISCEIDAGNTGSHG